MLFESNYESLLLENSSDRSPRKDGGVSTFAKGENRFLANSNDRESEKGLGLKEKAPALFDLSKKPFENYK